MRHLVQIHTAPIGLFFAATMMLFIGGCATSGQAGADAETAPNAARAAASGAACECADTGQAEAEAEERADDDEPALDAEPRAITSEEVTFSSRGDELHGVIDRPRTASEPLRAVVILHDASPLDRRGVFGGALGLQLPVEVSVYQELAETLAQNGYLVLRYDKRTCVEGGPPWCNYPREYVEEHREELAQALLSDATAAVEAVRQRDDVDPAQVVLLGHGQGAVLALAISDEVDASAMVLLAPSPYPVDQVILHQSEASLEHLKKRRAQEANTTMGTLIQEQLDALAKSYEDQKKAFATLRAGEVERANVLDAPAATWRDLFELHDQAMASLRSTRAPILAVFGEHDLELPADSAEKFQDQMPQTGHHEVARLAHITHLMVAIDDEDNDSSKVSDDVHQTILHFLLDTADTRSESEKDRELRSRNDVPGA